MRRCVVALLALLAGSMSAEAKTFKLGEGTPAAEITFPDAWDTEANEGAVEGTSSDKATYLSAEAIDASDVADAGKEVAAFLASQKVRVKPETRKAKETKVGDFPSVDISWDATDEDGPTRITLLLVKLSSDKVVVLTYWRSEAGEKDRGADVDRIEKSLKPIK